MNKVILIGHVGKDPEVKQFENGSIAKFSIATSETYKNKAGEKVTNTEWHNIVVNGKSVEVVEKWVKKGMQLSIIGKIRYRSYDDKDGNKKYFTEIQAEQFEFLSKAETTQAESSTSNYETTATPDTTDDLPF